MGCKDCEKKAANRNKHYAEDPVSMEGKWEAILKLSNLTCCCGRKIKEIKVVKADDKYVFFTATEQGKKQKYFCFVYDIETKQILEPGSFVAGIHFAGLKMNLSDKYIEECLIARQRQ